MFHFNPPACLLGRHLRSAPDMGRHLPPQEYPATTNVPGAPESDIAVQQCSLTPSSSAVPLSASQSLAKKQVDPLTHPVIAKRDVEEHAATTADPQISDKKKQEHAEEQEGKLVSTFSKAVNIVTSDSEDGHSVSAAASKSPLSESSPSVDHRTQLVAADNLANLALARGGSQPYGSRRVGPEDFVLLKVIGKGSYGKVMMVRYKHDNYIYAMKMLRKENIIKRNQVEHTRTERSVLETMSHPFIVQLYFAFQTPKKLYFVMEYCPGGELFFHLSRAGRFGEKAATFYAAEIILALEYLHTLDIVYRDLKPENVLLDEKGHVRLTDFGLSKEGVQDNFSAKSLCGTPEYLAPEILNQTGHGKAVDWWNLGALIYEMLTGLPPFYTRDRERLFENIRSGELRYPSYISDTAKSLLVGLFQRDPNRRLGGGVDDAAEIKRHPIFASIDWNNVYLKRETPPFRPCLHSQTDVQYFDKEFVRLPVENSEAAESALSQTVRDELFQGFSYDARDDGELPTRLV